MLYTREIAERIAAIYWPQLMDYRRGPEVIQLRQITLPRSAITEAVLEFRRLAEATGATSLTLARQRLVREYSQMLDRVEVAVAEQPLPRLQIVGSGEQTLPFLYDIGWGTRASFSPRRLHRDDPAGLPVRLRPGVGDQLVRLAPLIRPLVELHWTRMVATINKVATEEQDLHRHLFGRDRLTPPKALRDGLAELQAGRCFYCRKPFRRAPDADHFIPRVRCGIDAVENLALPIALATTINAISCRPPRWSTPGPTGISNTKARWPSSPVPAGGTQTLAGPWQSPGRFTVISRQASSRSGLALGGWT